MDGKTIAKLFEVCGLEKPAAPAAPVSGGFMHRMYKVDTAAGSYAVKHLNLEVMKRPEAMANYRRAERLEKIVGDAGIPIVSALEIRGRKMQEADGEYFYIFPWHSGRITDWYHITTEQCRKAGNIQGRIHAIPPGEVPHTEPEMSAIHWEEYIREAERQHSETAALLRENAALLEGAQDALNCARQALPDIVCITDEDMDPKNVMWENGEPAVIDLECLDYGNPVSHALQLSLQWSGITICRPDPELQKAFLEGWLEAYDCGFRHFGSVLGLAYTWIEWLEYNIRRVLGKCADEKERETGTSEVRNTIRRIRCIRDNEDRIRQALVELQLL